MRSRSSRSREGGGCAGSTGGVGLGVSADEGTDVGEAAAIALAVAAIGVALPTEAWIFLVFLGISCGV